MNPSEFETFEWKGMTRYRCPECKYDGPTQLDVTRHWEQVHNIVDESPGTILFDSDDKPINLKTKVG